MIGHQLARIGPSVARLDACSGNRDDHAGTRGHPGALLLTNGPADPRGGVGIELGAIRRQSSRAPGRDRYVQVIG